MARIPINTYEGPGSLEPQGEQHEHYFELCALATTGTLADQEWSDLKSHLAQCKQCADLFQKYRAVARTAMPLLLSEESVSDHNGPDAWTPDLAKSELFARIARGEQVGWVRHAAIPPAGQ